MTVSRAGLVSFSAAQSWEGITERGKELSISPLHESRYERWFMIRISMVEFLANGKIWPTKLNSV